MLKGQVAALQSNCAYACGHHCPVTTNPVSTRNSVKQDNIAGVAVVLNTGVEEEVYGETAGSSIV